MTLAAEAAGKALAPTSQSRFHTRWDHLHDPHVRALAWLLDASDLLDPKAPRWQGRIARLCIDHAAVDAWLCALEAAPQWLHARVAACGGGRRLGRYAEALMACYFEWRGVLVAHGLQVQAAPDDTIGEFDFLLREGADLVHYEFATKFYLFESLGDADPAEYFIGPNLADTLDAKMQKILQRQLALGQHPAARRYLPQPISRAQALIRGWLFYADQDSGDRAMPLAAATIVGAGSAAAISPGVAIDHCRGFWCSVGDFDRIEAQGFLVLPRLAWLAPARAAASDVSSHADMRTALAGHFAIDTMPVMVALMQIDGDVARESARGFVVPNDWRARVHQQDQRTVLRRSMP